VAAPEDHLALIPENQTFESASAATLAALTAWQQLVCFAKIKKGSKVLIQGASGGVGHYAVQIAKYFKAHVIGVSSSANRDFVLSLGVDEHIAYDEKIVEDEASEMDIVIDPFSGENLYGSLKMVRTGGLIISLLPFISEDVLQKAKSKDVDIHYELVKSNGSDMESIATLLKSGAIISHTSQIYSFDEMAKAHLAMETGKTVGKIVVTTEQITRSRSQP